MPLQNRIDPWGNIVATSARGTFMGNRGILHNGNRQIIRTYQHRNWIICNLQHKNVTRQLMSPGAYTELFFLDEASALAAGHRPCCECRRERYLEFKTLWVKANLKQQPQRIKAAEINRLMHFERIKGKTKITYKARLRDLPDGAFFCYRHSAYVIHKKRPHLWTFHGYRPAKNIEFPEAVDVLTPGSVVNTLVAGFKPLIHESIMELC